MHTRDLLSRLTTIAVALLMTACSANHKAIFRHQPLDSNAFITTTDAKQRAILSNKLKGDPQRFCAEPSPDVFSVIAQSLSAGGTFGQQADPKAIELAFNAAFASSEQGATIPRTQTINMLRELMYRTCERYLNGGISSLELSLQAIRDQRLMVSILAIEQLTGAVASKSVALGAMAQATAGASVGGSMALLDKARNEKIVKEEARDKAQVAYKLKVKAKVNDVDTDVEACVALDAAKTDVETKALPQSVKDKAGECAKLKEAMDQAEADHSDAKAHYEKLSKMADAAGIPVTSTNSLMTPTTLGGVDRLGGGQLGDVSSVVQFIVKSQFDQDEFAFLCLKVLSPELEEKLSKKLKDALDGRCLAYFEKRVDGQLDKIRLETERYRALSDAEFSVEFKRLQTTLDSQFDVFWKAISKSDGTAIDATRLTQIRQKSARTTHWPECLKDDAKKEDVKSCFQALVPYRRQDLIKAVTQP